MLLMAAKMSTLQKSAAEICKTVLFYFPFKIPCLYHDAIVLMYLIKITIITK